MTQLQLSGNTVPGAQVKSFRFGDLGEVRAVIDEHGNPWFVGSDLAKMLEYRDATHALRSVRDKNKGLHIVETPSGQQNCTCVNEPGLYQLIMNSRADRAEAFQDWVTDEVLPSIRETGQYSRSLSPAEQLLVQAQRLVDQEKRQAELDRQQRALERQQLETRLEVLEQASRLRTAEARLDSVEHNTGLFTILAHARANRITIDNRTAIRLGKAATHLYRQRHGVEPPAARDERYGSVNLYPQDLLVDMFAAEL